MAGLFIRERMFRVGRDFPLSVVSPQPWFPGQSILRRWRPAFRPGAPAHDTQRTHDVWYPRFFSFPSVLKRWDGHLMAAGAYTRMKKLRAAGRLDLIDAHFAYPDGAAAVQLAKRLGVPCTITMRGTESRLAKDKVLGPLMARALCGADRVFAVSSSLQSVALSLGVPAHKVEVVGNGVDIETFFPEPAAASRERFGVAQDAPVLITVGGLVERKGFHRVMRCLPELRKSHPGLQYLVVGGPSPEGDMTETLHLLRQQLGLQDCVHFLGALKPNELRHALSAANVFALSTRNEGWANVLLEAMACGLPVVTTDVGGNREVVCSGDVGTVVPFDDERALCSALDAAIRAPWDRAAIRRYAQANTWDKRVLQLKENFLSLARVDQSLGESSEARS